MEPLDRCALVTGAAQRIGAAIAERLHGAGYRVIVHYRHSTEAVDALCARLNSMRPDSAHASAMDLSRTDDIGVWAEAVARRWGGVDVLVNNASAFYPTAFGQTLQSEWDALLDTNLKAPFFLAQALLPWLQQRRGCIVNITDVHAQRGLPGFAAYSIGKAGLTAMTLCLAKELAPAVRVNAVAPGAILWPERAIDEAEKAEILAKVPLRRLGCPEDIAKAVLYLVQDADYVTGQVLTVDGGRGLFN